MYEVWAGDLLIHSDITPLETVKAINPVLTLEDSAAGSLSMSLPPINVGYSQDVIKRMVTDIVVKCDGEFLWGGRVLQDSFDFWNNRKLVCEGELAFLNDSIQPPKRYDTSTSHTTIESFLYSLIDIHNSQVEENRRFEKGMVTVTDGDQTTDSNEIYRFTNYETTLACINDKLVERLKGHIRVRHQDGKRYLDYISDDTLATNSQVVRFGVNLLDFSKDIDMSELATVIVPRGNRLDIDETDSRYIEGLEPYLTVEELGEKQEEGQVWHDNKSMFVKNPTAVSNFGWVSAVVDWPNVTNANTLYSKAVKYLKDEQYEKMTLEIQALDLKYLTNSETPIKFQSKLRCVSEPHNMDHTFIVSKVQIDLSNPANSLYTLGSDVKLTLTQASSKVDSDVQAQINSLPSKSEIVRAAERNAYQMIMGSDGNSFVHLIPGKNPLTGKSNGIQRIEVTDGPTYDPDADNDDDPTTDPFPDSLNRWIWTAGGLGHISRNTVQDPWDRKFDPQTGQWDDPTLNVAMTMDGQIVADRITTGTMFADHIRGGTLTLGGTYGEVVDGYGKIDVLDANNNAKIKIRHDRFEASSGYVVVINGGYIKHHEYHFDSDHYEWMFDLGCHYCNCMYYEDGQWHWVNGGATAIYKYLLGAYQPSDQRSKCNIEDLDPEFSKKLIMGTKPKMFEFNFKEGTKQFGMIAQDQDELLKDLGFTYKNGLLDKPSDPDEWMSIEYKQFVPHIINVVKEQQKEIEELKKAVKELQNKEKNNG